jgi:hypothetical protein
MKFLEMLKNNIVWIIALAILITVNFLAWVSYGKAKVELKKVQAENATLQEALKNPAVTQNPKVIYKTETRTVNLSDEERKALEAKYGTQVNELVNQINALQSVITSVSYDGGSTSGPIVPKNPNISTATVNAVDLAYRPFTIGAMYLNDKDLMGVFGWQPSKRMNLSLFCGYSRDSKYGFGALLRF